MSKKQPQGLIKGPYVMLRQEMKESLAYRALNNVDRKILDRLEIELMKHAGKNNGELICTYDDFAAYGIRRPSLAPGIRRLTVAGLLRITRKGWRSAINGMPAMYALTYLPIGDQPPTDEWRNYRPNSRHTETRPKIQNHSSEMVPTARSNEMVSTASNEMVSTAPENPGYETVPTFYNSTHVSEGIEPESLETGLVPTLDELEPAKLPVADAADGQGMAMAAMSEVTLPRILPRLKAKLMSSTCMSLS
jgi:hypothetical protein